MDKTTGLIAETDIKFNLRDYYYINKVKTPVNFKWITVGENTIGKQAFVYNAKWNYTVGELKFNPLPVKKNTSAFCEEGEGLMPDYWAFGNDDVHKTIEVLTGEADFGKLIDDVNQWRNLLCMNDQALYYCNLSLTDPVKNIKSNSEYNKTVATLLNLQIQYLTLINNNQDLLKNYYWGFNVPVCASKVTDVNEYLSAYEKDMNSRINWISFILTNSSKIKNISYWAKYPDCFTNCNSYTEYADSFTKWINKRIEWCNFCFDNYDRRSKINSSEISKLGNSSGELSAAQYASQFNQAVENSILSSRKNMGEIKTDDYLLTLVANENYSSDVKDFNRKLEGLFIAFNKYDALKNKGFDIHQMDYMTKPEEIISYVQKYFVSEEGYPLDLHASLLIESANGESCSINQTSRYIVFNDEYGTKEQLQKKGYVENKTMFYYPYHDGRFWETENNWRTGKQIMAYPNNQTYRQSDYSNVYYSTEKSVYFKFKNFPSYSGNGSKLADSEIEEMIGKLENEKGKENLILDISKNNGGADATSIRISEAVKKADIKNIYIIIDKGAFSTGDHFPLVAKSLYFKDRNVTLVGYPTKGGTSSGNVERYSLVFPEFTIYAGIPSMLVTSQSVPEGWGATPDVYANDLTEALGAIKGLTGDNEIQPFETPQRHQYNTDKKRWLDSEKIYEIKD